MKGLFFNVLKAGLLTFAVGALLAVCAPYIAMAVGLGASATAGGAITYAATAQSLGIIALPTWLGPFFGAFGAINALFEGVLTKKPETENPATIAITPRKHTGSLSQDLGVNLAPAHHYNVSTPDPQFASRLEKSRMFETAQPGLNRIQ